jgi:tetratricopeptide (TPR) repeat protein
MGRYLEAEAGYAQAAEVARQQHAALMVFSIRMCMVELYAEQGRDEDGRRELAEADAECDTAVPDGTPGNYSRQLAAARLELLRGRTEAAVAVFTTMVEDRTPSAGTISALLGRAEAWMQTGQVAAALEDARQALDYARSLQGCKQASFRVGLASLMIARAREQQGERAAAHEAAEVAVTHLSSSVAPEHHALALARSIAAGAPS